MEGGRWYHIAGNYHKLTRNWSSPDIMIRPWQVTALTMSSDAPGYLVRQLISWWSVFNAANNFLLAYQSQDFQSEIIQTGIVCYNKLSLWLVTVHLLTLAPAPTWEQRVRKYWDMSELLRDEGCGADDDVTQHMDTDNTERRMCGEMRLINSAHTFALATRLTLHVSFHPTV